MEMMPVGKSWLSWKMLAFLGLRMVVGIPLGSGSDISLAGRSQSRSVSTSVNLASRGRAWKPNVGDSWQIVLSSPIKVNTQAMSPNVAVWDLDLYDNSVDTFRALQTAGKRVICYFSAGSWESYRDDANQFRESDLGNVMDGWPDERWLDTRSSNVRSIMKARIAYAAKKGCDAVDPDNIDAYGNDTGLKLKKSDAINYMKFLSKTAASYGMSIGLKNSAEIIPSILDYVDFSIVEQCIEYEECETYAPFIDAGKPVFHIEYPRGAPNKISTSMVNKICKSPDTAGFTTVMKKLNLDGGARYCGSGQVYSTKTQK
ncbi:hypothetical protein QQZ08_003657 [Neonectria magnoliae]|uniref:alpha-galactosidase n=1 Tax=Neonectria magnoliae TaxID=2732573 RepID=A0ABR1IAK9_9HYPO